MELRKTIADRTSIPEGKHLFIAGVISAILLILILLTGLITFTEILEMERQEMEFCPFCI